ncbi:MAG: flagellar basal-body MS-ring/collar protein FliF [Mariprofundaceae bacterium]
MADTLSPLNAQTAPAMLAADATSSGVTGGLGGIQQTLVSHRRIVMFTASLLMLIGFIGLMLWSSETPYEPVYSGMDEKDAASIVEALQKEHIPYRLEGSGTILIPADQVHAARLKLAGQDLAPKTAIGFEIFDRSGQFGISDFSQKINLQRAMQGELARTIEVLPKVTAARVHLVMPKESAFIERERKASASVMLRVRGGARLAKKSVIAIQNLVAAGVPGLESEAVTVVDSSGNLLSADEKEAAMGAGQSQQEYQNQLERRMEERLTGMLEQLVGVGQTVVRVTSSIDREHVEQHNKSYNPDEQVLRSSSLVEENRSSSSSSPLGVPGMASNTPGGNPAISSDGTVGGATTASTPADSASRREQTSNYEISIRDEHRIIPFGTIKKLTVAVVVGGNYTGEEKTFVPRSAEELKAIRTLVERAVGFDEDRGDLVEVQSLPLMDISSGGDDTALTDAENKTFYIELARYLVATIALILLGWFLLRPMAQRIQSINRAEDEANAALAAVNSGAPGGMLTAASFANLEVMERARLTIAAEPDRAVKVIDEWVNH